MSRFDGEGIFGSPRETTPDSLDKCLTSGLALFPCRIGAFVLWAPKRGSRSILPAILAAILETSWNRPGSVLEAFWKRPGSVLEAFWKRRRLKTKFKNAGRWWWLLLLLLTSLKNAGFSGEVSLNARECPLCVARKISLSFIRFFFPSHLCLITW